MQVCLSRWLKGKDTSKSAKACKHAEKQSSNKASCLQLSMHSSLPASKGMRVDVMNSGRASVHHSMDTNASNAAQFCSCGFLKIFTSADRVHLELLLKMASSSAISRPAAFTVDSFYSALRLVVMHGLLIGT